MKRLTRAVLGCMWVCCGCSEVEKEPVRAPRPVVAVEAKPLPAFRPSVEGTCQAPYRPHGRTCVHDTFRKGHSAEDLAAQVSAYERGAAPPMVGVTAAHISPPIKTKKGHDPGALLGTTVVDPETSKREKLAALDRMIARLNARREEHTAQHKLKGAPPKRPAEQRPVPPAADVVPTISRTAGREPHADSLSETHDGPQQRTLFSQAQELLRGLSVEETRETLEKLESVGARKELGEEQWQALTRGSNNREPER